MACDESFKSPFLLPFLMEVKVLREEKDVLEIEFVGEGHTLCNLLRQELWETKEVTVASYRIAHPLVSEPILAVHAPKPRKVLLSTIEAAQEKIAALREKVSKL